MVTCRHLAVIGFALDDIDATQQSKVLEVNTVVEHLHPIKEIGASVLTIERL
jgi:hypothetical protein